MPGDPFDLDDTAAYSRWRETKLAAYPARTADLLVEIGDPAVLTAAEKAEILERVRRCNMAAYELASGPGGRDAVFALGRQFGLERLDAHLQADESCITALEVAEEEGGRSRYIPYTDRPIKWHTDGYYNLPKARIRGMVLHCVRPAAEGGENALLDPEIAYILLRDADPAFIRAFEHPRAFVVPPNEDGGKTLRGERPNPVFWRDGAGGPLYMNYSMRKRNMQWRDDDTTRAAVAFLEAQLAGDCPYVLRHRLRAGQGVICNNVLHDRSGFDDRDKASGGGRLMLRGRYFDRIAGT